MQPGLTATVKMSQKDDLSIAVAGRSPCCVSDNVLTACTVSSLQPSHQRHSQEDIITLKQHCVSTVGVYYVYLQNHNFLDTHCLFSCTLQPPDWEQAYQRNPLQATCATQDGNVGCLSASCSMSLCCMLRDGAWQDVRNWRPTLTCLVVLVVLAKLCQMNFIQGQVEKKHCHLRTEYEYKLRWPLKEMLHEVSLYSSLRSLRVKNTLSTYVIYW